jgi:hypothetical protein
MTNLIYPKVFYNVSTEQLSMATQKLDMVEQKLVIEVAPLALVGWCILALRRWPIVGADASSVMRCVQT